MPSRPAANLISIVLTRQVVYMDGSCLPLLAPSAPLSIVHSSTFPKGWTSLRTSSSLCCLLNMPTKSLRSSAKEGREDMVIMGFRMIPFVVTSCANEEGFTRFSMMKIIIWALGSKDITCQRGKNSQERERMARLGWGDLLDDRFTSVRTSAGDQMATSSWMDEGGGKVVASLSPFFPPSLLRSSSSRS